ncbi:MICOS complex subunit MIC13 isoform X1 [Tachyglossus aculeatus]|uniref:MICOS complex subunit MIC13 isoform X1 n=1 Tax=Tachyglossus aculeatus TaxID=9261 RepID=UPI0018F419B9|nr:MICOS complex subunit MIC13 isoform X1 [Tachyglossus aculeatus]
MAPRFWPVVKSVEANGFLVKGGVAGGAVYLVYKEGLLGSSDRGEAALKKAQAVVPPALRDWGAYLSRQTGVELPAVPQISFSLSSSWNSGVQAAMAALSVAPTRAGMYFQDGWRYVKDLIK